MCESNQTKSIQNSNVLGKEVLCDTCRVWASTIPMDDNVMFLENPNHLRQKSAWLRLFLARYGISILMCVR